MMATLQYLRSNEHMISSFLKKSYEWVSTTQYGCTSTARLGLIDDAILGLADSHWLLSHVLSQNCSPTTEHKNVPCFLKVSVRKESLAFLSCGESNPVPWGVSTLTCFRVGLHAAGGRTLRRRVVGQRPSAAAEPRSAAGTAPPTLWCMETRRPAPRAPSLHAQTGPSPPQASYPSAAGRRAQRPDSEPSPCCWTLSCPPGGHRDREAHSLTLSQTN